MYEATSYGSIYLQFFISGIYARTQCSNDFLCFSHVRISEEEEMQLFMDFFP